MGNLFDGKRDKPTPNLGFYNLEPPKAAPEVKRDGASTVCGRWRSGCKAMVEGRDPMRTCVTCRAAGAPARVSWEEAKPDNAATALPEIILEPLKNAYLSETAVHVADDPKDEVADFDRAPMGSASTQDSWSETWDPPPPPSALAAPDPSWGTFPCGHPRTSPPPFGFCGACNQGRL